MFAVTVLFVSLLCLAFDVSRWIGVVGLIFILYLYPIAMIWLGCIVISGLVAMYLYK